MICIWMYIQKMHTYNLIVPWKAVGVILNVFHDSKQLCQSCISSPFLASKQTIGSNIFCHCFYKFNNQALDLPHFKIFKNCAVRIKLLKNVECVPLLEHAAIFLNKTKPGKIPPMGFDDMKNKNVILSSPFLSTSSIITHYLAYCMKQMKVCWAAQFLFQPPDLLC